MHGKQTERHDSMRRFLLVMLLVAAVVGAAFGVYIRNQRPRQIEPRIERTTNQGQDWWVKFFRRGESSLSIDETGAHFQLSQNGRGLCLGDPDDPKSLKQMEFVSQFTLSKPGEIFWSPDHHGSATFTVKSITPEGVVLNYRTTFSHLAFGKNLVSIDEGEITLEPFQNQSGQETK